MIIATRAQVEDLVAFGVGGGLTYILVLGTLAHFLFEVPSSYLGGVVASITD
jgi:hypothetical protein